ncbi:hypothetical protein ABIA32_001890 [Streptacidiphilus sp. MAP12-20]|uniref:hypothetical protein n=1 Tax=Streptacidiphilus sp. MAP12-20 TaxID=3156299 RepID=UPI003517323B
MSADLSGGPNFSFLDQSSGTNILMDKTTTYLRIADHFAQTGQHGKHWLRAPIGARNGAPEHTMWGDIEDLQHELWPGSSLNVLADHRGTQDLGTETIDGVPATHYRGQVTAKEVTAHVPASAAVRAGMLQRLLASGRTSNTIDIWLDQSGRLLRDKETVPSSAGTTVIDRTYSMFGTPRDIQPPPAQDTAEMPPKQSTA